MRSCVQTSISPTPNLAVFLFFLVVKLLNQHPAAASKSPCQEAQRSHGLNERLKAPPRPPTPDSPLPLSAIVFLSLAHKVPASFVSAEGGGR